ncbi:unnamed protein product [Ectocarpus sp. CCAP 1310/34]|nr:unnamed protein product [Ectocarpus sp. CCAP 1310/34]
MPVKTTLDKRGGRMLASAQEARRRSASPCVLLSCKKVPLRIILKGTPFILPEVSGKGKRTQLRKGSISAEVALGNRTKFGHRVWGTWFGAQENSWYDARECAFSMSERWRLRPNNGSIIKQRPSNLVLDDLKGHRDKAFIDDLGKRCNTSVSLIPGGLAPLLQPLDRMLNKQTKRLLRAKYTAYTATAVAGPWDGVYVVPEGVASNHPRHGQDLLQICGLTLTLDGKGYPELLQEQRVESEKAHPGVSLPPFQLPEVHDGELIGTNPITAAEKMVQGRRLPPADVELLEYDSDLEFLGVSGGRDKSGELTELCESVVDNAFDQYRTTR